MSDLQAFTQITQIAQNITVVGLLLGIVFAFYSNRVTTTRKAEADKVEAVAAKDRELLLVTAAHATEKERADRFEGYTLELLRLSQGLEATTRESVQIAKRVR